MQSVRAENSAGDQNQILGQFFKQGKMAVFVFFCMALGAAPLFLYLKFNPDVLPSLINTFLQK